MCSLFFGTPSPNAITYVTDKKHAVGCNRASLCVVLVIRTYITCARVQTMSICPNLYNTTLEAAGTQLLAIFSMLLCGVFWGSSRNHYYLLLVLVMRALATSVSMYDVCMYVYLPKFNKQMHYYDIYRCTMGIFFIVNIIICFETKYYVNLEIISC